MLFKRYFKDAAISKPKTKHGIEVHYDSVGTSLYNRKEEQAAKGTMKILFSSTIAVAPSGKKGSWREDGCVVDFSGWLRRVVPVGQMEEVLLKVDIEGSEWGQETLSIPSRLFLLKIRADGAPH
ncbi:hypothetical protein Pmar_PMAR006567 [Perkinsus marinus ATCC 50983]|uniref:Uncharacterized protein n=1 Tax=Perkinsus marinus (strain ATCC 50983 / TXsc) TaxID=423536 RepID=C5LTT0_PERM5|nr:hypothetical protein Pmar_PMAR006567 [Perkinsus marinus ATCC 50983]EEQ99892.1 hypothetical protein Pmar_PMAR006567 [Perkinsus marinus ATCC 50983]|eukprot:XP_002767175.1 hypothetical protein Pmar_PMAR006567 [Perkinsus marinus ATCC 50983]